MIDLNTQIEMLLDMSPYEWTKKFQRGDDVCYYYVHKDMVFYIIIDLKYETLTGHMVKCDDDVDIDNQFKDFNLLYCRPLITPNNTREIGDRFDLIHEGIENALS